MTSDKKSLTVSCSRENQIATQVSLHDVRGLDGVDGLAAGHQLGGRGVDALVAGL